MTKLVFQGRSATPDDAYRQALDRYDEWAEAFSSLNETSEQTYRGHIYLDMTSPDGLPVYIGEFYIEVDESQYRIPGL